ncbi:MAG: hypothetical protein ABJL99_05835 [Aliishimia sp.]
MLNKIRMLEASRDSGALSEEDFERAKARLLDTVEDAVEPLEDVTPAEPEPDAQPRPKSKSTTAPKPDPKTSEEVTSKPKERRFFRSKPKRTPKSARVAEILLPDEEFLDADEPPKAAVWQMALLCAVGLIGVTILAVLLIGDLSMALTLVVTIIAAITVRAMHLLDD